MRKKHDLIFYSDASDNSVGIIDNFGSKYLFLIQKIGSTQLELHGVYLALKIAGMCYGVKNINSITVFTDAKSVINLIERSWSLVPEIDKVLSRISYKIRLLKNNRIDFYLKYIPRNNNPADNICSGREVAEFSWNIFKEKEQQKKIKRNLKPIIHAPGIYSFK